MEKHAELLARLAEIRSQRPWAQNTVYQCILEGKYSPEQVAVWAGQWRWHMATAPIFFAGVFGRAPVANPLRWQLLGLLGGSTAGSPNVRLQNERRLSALQKALSGFAPPLEHVPKLPETIAHLGLMRDVTWNRSAAEGAAAFLSTKPGFSLLCEGLAAALRSRYGLDDEAVEFLDVMAARRDEGEVETEFILSEIDQGSAAAGTVEVAFRDGLCSYHLILDGCHRAAGGEPDPAASRPLRLSLKTP